MGYDISVRDRSTECLRTIHEFVQHCMDVDRDTGPEQAVYGVRIHPGWRSLANSIEQELALRDEAFTTIKWDDPLFFSGC